MKQYKSVWQQLAKSHTITSTDVFHYCLIRAINSKTESYEEKLAVTLYYLHKAFTAVTNENKLSNGWPAYHAVRLASNHVGTYAIQNHDYTKEAINPWHCLDTQAEKDLFLQLEKDSIQELCKTADDKYTFIFVRQDMTPEQQMVQATHIVEAVTKDMIFSHILSLDAENRGLLSSEYMVAKFPTCNHVLVGVKDTTELENIARELSEHHIPWISFSEPDMNMELTALATWPMSRDEKRFLRSQKLLKITQQMIPIPPFFLGEK